METTGNNASFTSPLWRLVALLVAIAAGYLAWLAWQDAEQDVSRLNDPVLEPATLDDMGTSDGVRTCIEERVSEINGLVEEGLMSEEAATISKGRAANLCRKQQG